MKWLAIMARWGLTLIGVLLIAGMIANVWVWHEARGRVHDDILTLPTRDVALVLGTSPYTRTGQRNVLFAHRIRAAAQLYHSGRVHHILVSGANPGPSYNEPRKMYQALRRRNVPDWAITLDFAGFRTLDSVVRARRIFGLESFIVVSQRYHEYRALFMAQHEGLDVVGYVWPGEDRRQSLRTEAREYLARIRAVLDLYLLKTPPHVLGAGETIRGTPSLAAHQQGLDQKLCLYPESDKEQWLLATLCQLPPEKDR